MVAVEYTTHDSSVSGNIIFDAAGIVGETPGGTTGDSFVNTGYEKVYVKNASTSTTVNFDATSATFTGGTCSYGTDHDPAPAVGASAISEYGPFPVSRYSSSIDVTYGRASDLLVIVMRDTPG